ncbi:dipeptidyl-peptidase 3 family protein [Spirochaeta isovalerica]|uniref:Peptidase family M49 n=1 Tax=Spirochaeta isovalerica TaxID=150 RepID=A0A841RD55_9SPIO|nr:hypothetical protein [Spirochaeta isovalerica]MBB6480578.1 hypothetical protein [Spirochaeta isovalerica]
MNPIEEILNQFKEVPLEADLESLPEDVRSALPYIRQAMDLVTRIFLRQQHEHLPEHYDSVMKGEDEWRKRFYELFKGPWNQLTDFKSEYPDVNNRSAGCAFYPEDWANAKIKKTVEAMSGPEKEAAMDTYTVLRDNKGKLEAIPYHVYYAEELGEVFDLLEKAADMVEHEGLSSYLINRAEALVSGNYRESDAEWVRLTDSPVDLVIGPYEVYADALLGVKATYESMLMVVDREKGNALKEIESNLENLAAVFPVQSGAKAAVGGVAPIVVVDQIYSGGEAAQGVMAAAFNLPNDAWVRGNVGWKQVMLHNVMKAKFTVGTKEIAKKVMHGGENVDFDPMFTFVLLHEISHGLGPAYRADGRETAKCIGSSYVAIEETKADTGALYLILKLGGQYGINRYDSEVLLKTYLAGLFRSMRFGVHEAHGKANVIQFNWLKEKGVITRDGDRFAINAENIQNVAEELLVKVCTIEAAATPEEAEDFLREYGTPGEDILNAIGKLSDIPTDIKPVFPEF